MKLGERIKEKRLQRGYEPCKVASKLNVEVEEYMKWEAGECEPDTETLLKLAKILGTNATALLYGRDGLGSQSMFPKDAVPAVTPISDWRFLIGAMVMFAGGVGVLWFIMRNTPNAHSFYDYIEIGGFPLLGLAGVFLIGLIICIVSSFTFGRDKKKKKKSKKGKNK